MASSQIWVAGEALIDLVPHGEAVISVVGGGAANTAKALARLGQPTAFIGGISTDKYGVLIESELSGVDLRLGLRSSLPTASASVTLDKTGSASYEFKLENTATFDFRGQWLPKGNPAIVHIGTLATVVEPGASELLEWASNLDSLLVYDPNVRPTVLPDKLKYREKFNLWAQISDVIKMSDEDFSWLGFSHAQDLLELGPKLIVITHGADGMTGHTNSGSVSVPGVLTKVVDTVGAGDTVGAIIVEGLINYGIDSMMSEKLFEVLTRAAKAAAITCSRVGANPPNLSELK